MRARYLLVALLVTLALPSAAAAHPIERTSSAQTVLPERSRGLTASVATDGGRHSQNMRLVGNFRDGGKYGEGTDLAFWGNYAVAGVYGPRVVNGQELGEGGFRLIDISDPTSPREVGQLECPGPQNDVSIWRNLVFLSVDSPRSGPECGAGSATTTQVSAGQAYEGIRVVSIADPAKPRQIKFVDTDCGSHTHTLVPDLANRRVLIYVLSYPLGGQSPECNSVSHRKISVVTVPLSAPSKARVIATPSVSPAIGCHDVTVLLSKKLAGAACISESQVWNISDPVHPRVLSHISNPAIDIHHSTTFSFDGRTLAIGDELGGAAASPGCQDPGDDETPLGAIWFYDVSTPRAPVLKGHFRIPQTAESLCTAHNFNTVPMKTNRDVLVSAWYKGGTTVVDFTDPTAPRQLGWHIPNGAMAWSSYWYRGRIYVNNFISDRGFDVMTIANRDLRRNSLWLGRLNPQTMEPLPR